MNYTIAAHYWPLIMFLEGLCTKISQFLKKRWCQKKDTQNWVNIRGKSLHNAFVNIMMHLSMSLLFLFCPYLGRVFFFDIFWNFFRISNLPPFSGCNSITTFLRWTPLGFLWWLDVVLMPHTWLYIWLHFNTSFNGHLSQKMLKIARFGI